MRVEGISSRSECSHLEEKWEALAVMATNGDEDSAKWLYVRTGGLCLDWALRPLKDNIGPRYRKFKFDIELIFLWLRIMPS